MPGKALTVGHWYTAETQQRDPITGKSQMSLRLPPGLLYVVIVNKGEILNASGREGECNHSKQTNVFWSLEKRLDRKRNFFFNLICCGFIKHIQGKMKLQLQLPVASCATREKELQSAWEGHSPRTQVYKTAVMEETKQAGVLEMIQYDYWKYETIPHPPQLTNGIRF